MPAIFKMNRIIRLKEARKDPPSKWTADWAVPFTTFDVNDYQDKLNKIAGFSRGEPILKLEWGGTASYEVYTEWVHGSPLSSVLAPKYAIRRIVNGVELKIPIRRWVIAQRAELEQLDRPKFTDERGITKPMGELNRSGEYTPYIFVGDHTYCAPDCCAKKICVGDYKDPGEAELSLIRKHTALLNLEFEGNPYSKVNSEFKEKIDRDVAYDEKKRKEKENEKFDEQSLEWFRLHGHRLSDSATPTTLKHGKFIDLGANNVK